VHCCNPGREKGCARNLSGVRRQGGDSGCPSGQSTCQDPRCTRDDYRRQRLSRGETKARHHLPNRHVIQAEVNPRTFRPNMIRVAHTRNVRMESLECFLRSRGSWVSAIDSTASYLGVSRAHTHSLGNLVVRVSVERASLMVADTYLLVNNDINFHTLLGFALKNPVKAPLWMVGRGAT
jgi:hypothetical protein